MGRVRFHRGGGGAGPLTRATDRQGIAVREFLGGVTIMLLLAVLPVGAASFEVRDASRSFEQRNGVIVVLAEGRFITNDTERARARFVPASSFKIPNAMIALETGVAPGADYLLKWDGKRPDQGFWPRSWSRDHTLRSALGNGVVWYFQEMARRIGRERMTAFLEQFDYGNRDISGPIDRFWLEGPLEISALEQVEFLQRFRASRLGLSDRTTALVREILVLDRNDSYTLSGKTGTARMPGDRLLGWLVGYVEQGDRTQIFALNLDCADFAACDHAMRRRAALSLLADWGLLRGASEADE